MVKIIDTTYTKAGLKQVADNATHLNVELKTHLLSLLKDFEDVFDGTLGDWETGPVNLDLKPGSKPINSRHFLVPIIIKIFFYKELKS